MKGNKKVLYIIMCFAFLLSFGVSYAYFSANVKGNEEAKNITMSSTTLKLDYNDDLEIKADRIVPDWSSTKVISVTNTGDGEAYYMIVFQNLKNTITNSELVISAECSGLNDSICEGIEETPIIVTEGESDVIIKDAIKILPGEKHNYMITIKFIDDGIQNYNQGKEFISVLGIKESNKKYNLKLNIKDESGNALANKTVSILPSKTLTTDSNGSVTFDNVNVGNNEITIDDIIKQKITIDGANEENITFNEEVYSIKAYQSSDSIEVNVSVNTSSVSNIDIVRSINCINKTLAKCLIDNYEVFGLTKIDQTSNGNQSYDTIEYRYQGNNPNNYITFNDEDKWRIVGVFEVLTYLNDNELDTYEKNFIKEYKVKIVRDSLDNTKSWTDVKMSNRNTNAWDTSTLKKYLNSDYYNTLTENATNKITSTKWYLGNVDSSNNLKEIYSEERSNNVTSGNFETWNGKIGLLYPSDYMYASSGCFNASTNTSNQSGSNFNNSVCTSTNYLFDSKGFYTLSPNGSNEAYVISTSSSGIINQVNGVNSGNIRPVIYLATNSRYLSGDGTSINRFKLK